MDDELGAAWVVGDELAGAVVVEVGEGDAAGLAARCGGPRAGRGEAGDLVEAGLAAHELVDAVAVEVDGVGGRGGRDECGDAKGARRRVEQLERVEVGSGDGELAAVRTAARDEGDGLEVDIKIGVAEEGAGAVAEADPHDAGQAIGGGEVERAVVVEVREGDGGRKLGAPQGADAGDGAGLGDGETIDGAAQGAYDREVEAAVAREVPDGDRAAVVELEAGLLARAVLAAEQDVDAVRRRGDHVVVSVAVEVGDGERAVGGGDREDAEVVGVAQPGERGQRGDGGERVGAAVAVEVAGDEGRVAAGCGEQLGGGERAVGGAAAEDERAGADADEIEVSVAVEVDVAGVERDGRQRDRARRVAQVTGRARRRVGAGEQQQRGQRGPAHRLSR